MSGRKFFKQGQVRGEIIESIFVQPLWMTQTQKIITCMVLTFWNFTNGYWGMCMIGEKFLKEWQVTDKVIESFFFTIHIFILQMTQTQGIITHRVLKIHEWIWGDVYEWGKVP